MKTIAMLLFSLIFSFSAGAQNILTETITNHDLWPDQEIQPLQNIVPMFYTPGRSIDPEIFQQYITDFQNTTLYPGMSICFLRDGEVYWKEHFGFQNLAQFIPVDDQTTYTVASISKTIMITAVMQLYEQGLFELDDDINAYLPWPVRNPNFPDIPITIHQLATHTSSIKDNTIFLDNTLAVGDNPLPMGDFLQGYFSAGGTYYSLENFNTYEPGAAYNYSNIASCLLAFILECLTEIDFETYCQQYIFNPLGITASSYMFANLDPQYLATPYRILNGMHFELPQYTWPVYPIAQLKISALQLAKHLSMYMNYGQFNNEIVLDSTSVDLITQVHNPGSGSGCRGLIWQIDPFLEFFSHNGLWRGFSTHYGFNLEENYGRIWLANGRHYTGVPPETNEFVNNLTLYARQYRPFSIEALTVVDTDNDGILEPGETVNVYLDIRNNTNITPAVSNLVIACSTEFPGISFTGDTIIQLGSLDYLGTTSQAGPIQFFVESTAPQGKINLCLQFEWDESGKPYRHELELFIGQADILLVNDEMDWRGDLKQTSNWYLEALDSIKSLHPNLSYQLYDRHAQGGVSLAFLDGFKTVIWFTGYDTINTLTLEDQNVLSSYLSNGGTLFISGQNISEDLEGSSFMTDYLHAVHVSDLYTGWKRIAGVDNDPMFDGFLFDLEGADSTSANNQNSPNVIEAHITSGGEKCLGYYPNLEGCGVRYNGNYKTIFFSYGFEAIATKAKRVEVLQKILDFFDVHVNTYDFEKHEHKLAVYPNPFSGSVSIEYTLSETGSVELSIYNQLGVLVDVLMNETVETGKHRINWKAEAFSAGLYFVVLKSGNKFETGKIVKIK